MDAPEIRLRESPRFELKGRARLHLVAGGPAVDAHLLDLSTTGMGLASPAAAVAGQTCTFALALDGDTVEGRGVVVWSRRARPDRGDAANLGVRFAELDPSSATRIASLVERRLTETRRFSAPPPAVAGEVPAAPAPPLPEPPPPEVSTAAVPTAEEAPEVPAQVPGDDPQEGAPQVPADDRQDDAPQPRSARRLLPWLAFASAVVIVVVVMAGRGRDPRDRVPLPAPVTVPAAEESAPLAPPSAAVPVTALLPPTEAAAPPLQPPSEATEPPDAVAPDAAPVAAGEPAAAEAALAAPAGGDQAPGTTTARARRLLAIEPAVTDGGEVLALRADGPFREQDVFAALIGPDPPRYLLRLSGIERQWQPADLAVASALIQRVRTGLHATPRGPELHVVLDLSSRRVEHAWEIEGDILRVRLRPRTP
jgi:hypothetical protein